MRNYEVTFIVDPALSDDEIKTAAKTYHDKLKKAGQIVFFNEMGVRQLAYPINNRNTGIYYCIEFEIEKGEFIRELELIMRRDERLLRFLTVKLDKYGVQYNADKRAGKIGTVKKKKKKDEKEESRDRRRGTHRRNRQKKEEETPKVKAPAEKEIAEEVKEAPTAEKAIKETEIVAKETEVVEESNADAPVEN